MHFSRKTKMLEHWLFKWICKITNWNRWNFQVKRQRAHDILHSKLLCVNNFRYRIEFYCIFILILMLIFIYSVCDCIIWPIDFWNIAAPIKVCGFHFKWFEFFREYWDWILSIQFWYRFVLGLWVIRTYHNFSSPQHRFSVHVNCDI